MGRAALTNAEREFFGLTGNKAGRKLGHCGFLCAELVALFISSVVGFKLAVFASPESVITVLSAGCRLCFNKRKVMSRLSVFVVDAGCFGAAALAGACHCLFVRVVFPLTPVMAESSGAGKDFRSDC